MKLSIGSNIVKGPWGGGNKFAIGLTNYLKDKGSTVIDHLNDRNIDIILMTEPRKNLVSCKYNQLEISKYLIRKPDTIVVHRINECDERKGTKNVNKYLQRANRVADHTVFISSFLQKLFIGGEILDTKNHSVIRNGADNTIFNMKNRTKWDKKSTLKLVTHHWGGNYYKGFDVYEILDLLVKDKLDNINLEFNYIGNIPRDFTFKNSKVYGPLNGKDLANKIKENHIYITASINEPAGMHHIEGAMCGLPLLYRNSGGIPEYAKSFGVMFDGKDDFTYKLRELIKNYDNYYSKMKNYPYNSKLMCSKYEKLLNKLLANRDKFDLKSRRKKYLGIYLKEKFIPPEILHA